MREMKDSGIPWIEEIPEHWDIKPIKYLLGENKEKNDAFNERNALQFKMGTIVKKTKDSDEIDNLEDTYSKYIIVNEGDVVINGLNLSFDFITQRVALVEERGLITSTYFVVTPLHQINERFLNYLLKSYDNCKALHSMGRGLRSILTFNEFRKYCLVYPSISEQQKIATYLDQKVALIDNIIEKTKQSIDEYKKYKQSLITETVTKGLNPDVKMKDSGIEWIGEIPEHWEVVNPKRLFDLRKEKAFEDDEQLTASQKHGILPQKDFMEIENQKVVTVEKDFSILKHVEPNDFVISMRSFQGGLEYSTVRGCISSAYVMIIPKQDVYPPFFRWLFKSEKYINALQSTSNLVRDGQAMRFSNFVQIPLFQIPNEEQKTIADFLDIKTGSIDQLINTKEVLLSELEAYKKSLIYEVVTGKKEV